MIRKLLHIPAKNTNCVCWFHFFFPPKNAIYPDGKTASVFENGKRITRHTSYTFRHFFHSTILLGDYRCEWKRGIQDFWKVLGIPANLAFRIGAIAQDFDNSDAAGGTSGSHSHTCTGSNLILFSGLCSAGGTDDFGVPTYNSVSIADVVTETSQFPGATILGSLAGPATGANTYAWTKTESRGVQAISSSYTGVAQTTPENFTSGGQGVGSTMTGTLNTVADNAWLVCVGGNESGVSGAGANTTARFQNSNGFFGDSNAAQTPAGTYSQAFTYTSGKARICVASFAPAAAAGATFIPSIIIM